MSIYIDICQFRGLAGWQGTFDNSCTIHKSEKVTRTRPILNSNSTSFSSNIFLPMANNKKVKKRDGSEGPTQMFSGSVRVQ